MTGKKSLEDRFIWKKDDMSITRALVFLGDQQKIRAEKILSAAKEELNALDETSHR
ncbi:MAG: hypothetical protein LUQ61_07465 [Methanoregulaceae archaeon]|jgi:hypothetical protein|nr:hypothetical protein [Methanoregulaceae archaeon]